MGFSLYNILTGTTYGSTENEYGFDKYKTLYREENPISFWLTVALNGIFGLVLFDLANNIGIISTFNSIKTYFFK